MSPDNSDGQEVKRPEDPVMEQIIAGGVSSRSGPWVQKI